MVTRHRMKRFSWKKFNSSLLRKNGRLGKNVQFNIFLKDKTGYAFDELSTKTNPTWGELGKEVYKATRRKNVDSIDVTLE